MSVLPPDHFSKTAWRQYARTQRQRLNIAALSAQIVAQLANWPDFAQAEIVLAYAAHQDEINLAALQQQFPHKRWYLPCVEAQNQLRFRRHDNPNTLVKNRYGIAEPPSSAPELHDEWLNQETALIIVPALMTDAQGYRLGYGKGYYDRFLSQSPQAFPGQVTTLCPVPRALHVPQLPHDAWDRPVGFLVQEHGVIPIADYTV